MKPCSQFELLAGSLLLGGCGSPAVLAHQPESSQLSPEVVKTARAESLSPNQSDSEEKVAQPLIHCREKPELPPSEAFDEPGHGCLVELPDWSSLYEAVRSRISLGMGPECTDEELCRCQADCTTQHVDACVGLVNARHRGAAVELGEALDVTTRACEDENANACHAVANIWLHGLAGESKDRARAFQYRERACSLGQGSACAMLGHMRRNGGDGIEQSTEAGYELVQHGCQLGDATACNDFGWSMLGGTWDRAREPERALKLFVYSCERGVAHGCGSLGEALENGWGVNPSLPWARAFWSIQCEHHAQPEACEAVARLDAQLATRSE